MSTGTGSVTIQKNLLERNSLPHYPRRKGLPLKRRGRDGRTLKWSGSCHCSQGTETIRKKAKLENSSPVSLLSTNQNPVTF